MCQVLFKKFYMYLINAYIVREEKESQQIEGFYYDLSAGIFAFQSFMLQTKDNNLLSPG